MKCAVVVLGGMYACVGVDQISKFMSRDVVASPVKRCLSQMRLITDKQDLNLAKLHEPCRVVCANISYDRRIMVFEVTSGDADGAEAKRKARSEDELLYPL